MEFWEGAILIVGGVWLVSHMARKNRQAQQTIIGTSTLGASGTSNESNLTNLTNTAGGTPTIYGEPLQAPNPPLAYPVRSPMIVAPTPYSRATPILRPGQFVSGSPVHTMML